MAAKRKSSTKQARKNDESAAAVEAAQGRGAKHSAFSSKLINVENASLAAMNQIAAVMLRVN